jgi:RND family efflux transporter MFP subunit
VEKVKERKFSPPVTTFGRIVMPDQVKLSFKTGGVIKNIYFEEGHKVKKGDLMATLKMREIDASIKKAREGLKKAKRDFQRIRNLYEDSVVPQQDYDNALTALELAQADFDKASFNLKHSSIFAPSNGVVLKVLYEEGEITSAGMPVIYFGSTPGKVHAIGSVNSKDIQRVSTGDSCLVIFDEKIPEKKGFVIRKSAMSNTSTGTYDVKIEIPDRDQKLLVGLVVKLIMYPQQASSMQYVSVDAMTQSGEDVFNVFTVNKLDSVVRKKVIRTGFFYEDRVWFEPQLNTGTYVVVGGHSFITEGARVVPEVQKD